MSRIIKFRAWDNVKLYDFVELTSFKDGSLGIDISETSYSGLHRASDNVILEQFTGLTDKNGVDIYEGDIVDLNQTINGVGKFSIEWDGKRMGWTLRYYENMVNPRTYEYDVSDVFTVKELEVIGNIHQNNKLNIVN